MINEELLKKFLEKWIEIPDEEAEYKRCEELDKIFFEDHTEDDARAEILHKQADKVIENNKRVIENN